MEKNVVCSESELLKAANKIRAYVEFLQRQMEQYSRILSAAQKTAVNDDLICSKLSDLEEKVSPLSASVFDAVDAKLKKVIREEVSEIESADNFAYPDAWLGEISSLLQDFYEVIVNEQNDRD